MGTEEEHTYEKETWPKLSVCAQLKSMNKNLQSYLTCACWQYEYKALTVCVCVHSHDMLQYTLLICLHHKNKPR